MQKTIRGGAFLAVVFLAACAAISQQKAQTAVTDSLEFHNLRVLPANITHDELITTMRGFARSLGVRCNHCHVPNPPGSKEEFDYPNDSKPEKRAARTMLRMVRDINQQYVGKVNEHGQTVGCVTCHRGHAVPDVALAQLPPRPPGPGAEPPASGGQPPAASQPPQPPPPVEPAPLKPPT